MLRFTDHKRKICQNLRNRISKRFKDHDKDQNSQNETSSCQEKDKNEVFQSHQDQRKDANIEETNNEAFSMDSNETDFNTPTTARNQNALTQEGSGNLKAFPFKKVLYDGSDIRIVVKRQKFRNVAKFKLDDHQFVITSEKKTTNVPLLKPALPVIFEGLREILEELRRFYKSDLNRMFKLVSIRQDQINFSSNSSFNNH